MAHLRQNQLRRPLTFFGKICSEELRIIIIIIGKNVWAKVILVRYTTVRVQCHGTRQKNADNKNCCMACFKLLYYALHFHKLTITMPKAKAQEICKEKAAKSQTISIRLEESTQNPTELPVTVFQIVSL